MVNIERIKITLQSMKADFNKIKAVKISRKDAIEMLTWFLIGLAMCLVLFLFVWIAREW
jgi:hypothetical protein